MSLVNAQEVDPGEGENNTNHTGWQGKLHLAFKRLSKTKRSFVSHGLDRHTWCVHVYSMQMRLKKHCMSFVIVVELDEFGHELTWPGVWHFYHFYIFSLCETNSPSQLIVKNQWDWVLKISVTIWEIRLFSFLPRVRWVDGYHSHICMCVSMKLARAAG